MLLNQQYLKKNYSGDLQASRRCVLASQTKQAKHSSQPNPSQLMVTDTMYVASMGIRIILL